jgi:7,8-dihydroneopterin aldolase/epimerase/oxygenase
MSDDRRLDRSEDEGMEPEMDLEDELESSFEEMGALVTVEVKGLSLYTRHGVTEAERDLGQRLVIDVEIELPEAGATVTDRVEDTADYADVCEQVALAAQERSYKTLERLCSAIADRLADRYDAHSVRIRAAKPEPPIPLPVEEVAVEVWKEG